jgi:ankyrin repeat protein
MMAAFRGHARVVQELLHGGADPAVRDKYGKTARWYAQTEDARNFLRQVNAPE